MRADNQDLVERSAEIHETEVQFFILPNGVFSVVWDALWCCFVSAYTSSMNEEKNSSNLVRKRCGGKIIT